MSKLNRLEKNVHKHLQRDEEILARVQGHFETKRLGISSLKSGAMFATNQRLVFFAKRLFGYELEHFPYKNISSFEMGKHLLGHYVRFFSSGNEVRLKWIQTGNIDEFVRIVRESMSPIGTGQAPSVVAPSSDIIVQLEQLGKLRDSAIISNA